MQNRQSGRRRRGGGNSPRPMGMAQGGQANRLEVRVRGNAHQLLEKYKVMARDAHQAGDRVAAEYYLQHSDHYFRVLNDSRIRNEEMRARRGVFDPLDEEGPDEDSDMGDDRDDNGGERSSYRQPRRDEPNDRERPEPDDRPRSDRARDDRNRDDRPRDLRPREERPDRAERPRRDDGERWRREEQPVARAPRRDRDDAPPEARPVVKEELSDGEAALAAFGGLPGRESGREQRSDEEAPAPRRRGRPRKVVTEAAPLLATEDATDA